MSSCNVVLDQPIISCLSYAEDTDECAEGYNEAIGTCDKEEDQGYEHCDQEQDQGYQHCDEEKDFGYEHCDQKKDMGYKNCCTWWPCSWACKAWTWVSNWVCVASHWVANVLCVASHWVKNIVCIVSHWVQHWVCVAWNWIYKWVCLVWKWILKIVCTIVGWFTKIICELFLPLYCLGKALWDATPFSDPPPASPIKKLFVLVLENRSYDHMLGFANLAGPDPFTGARRKANDFFDDAGQKDLTKDPFINPTLDGSGTVSASDGAPFKLSEAQKDPPHEFDDGVVQTARFFDATDNTWKNPSIDSVKTAYPPWTGKGFVARAEEKQSSEPDLVMKAFDPRHVTVLTTLAREFAVCDNWRSSVPGPTWPNRFFIHAASSGGLDGSPSKMATIGSAVLDGYRFENGTIFDGLDDQCVKWRIFEGDEMPQIMALSGMTTKALSGHFSDMHEFEAAVSNPGFAPGYIFIEPAYGDIIHSTYLCGNSQHPRDDVTRGEALIKRVYDAIRQSPHWESSALLITYDEHGGFFDHDPPEKDAVPPGDKHINNPHSSFEAPFKPGSKGFGFKFDRYGVRVPAVVVSPLIPRGTVDHTLYDHASIVRTAGKIFGFSPRTKRDAAAADFLHLFSLKTPRDTPVAAPDPADSHIRCVGFNPLNNDQSLGEDIEEATDFLLSRLPTAPVEVGGREDGVRDHGGPVPDSFWGFMHIALMRAHRSARSKTERKALIADYHAVESEAGARRFQLRARLMVARKERKAVRYEGYAAEADEPPRPGATTD